MEDNRSIFLKFSKGKYLKLILLLAFLIRVVISFPVFMDADKSKHNDSNSYHKIAQNLISGNGYSNCDAAPYHKDIEITPVYPVFLAGVYKVFGQDFRFVVFIQLLLDLLIVLLIFRISMQLFASQIGASVAAGLYAFSFHALTYSSGILTECLFTFLLISLVYFIVCVRLKNIYVKTALIGIFWVILVLCRPIALYTLPLLLFLWYVVELKERSFLELGKQLVLTAFVAIIGLTPWLNRNYELCGLRTVSSISDYNLYGVNANSIVAKQKGLNEDEHRKKWLKKLESPLFAQCAGNYNYVKEAREKGLQMVKDNLGFYTWIHLGYLPNMFLPEVTKIGENWGMSSGNKGTLAVINQKGFVAGLKHYYEGGIGALLIMLPLLLIWIVTTLGSFMALYKLLVQRRFGLLIALCLILGYYVFLPGPVSTPRFMYPMVPLLCILSGFALGEWISKPKRS